MSGERAKYRHFPYIKQNSIAEIVSTMESFLASCTDLDIGVKLFDKLKFVELFVLSKLILFKIKWFCIEFFNKKLIDV